MAFLRSPTRAGLPYCNKVLDLLLLLHQVVPENARAWRKTVWEIFHDADFFLVDVAGLRKWRRLVELLMAAESSSVVELLQGWRAFLHHYHTARMYAFDCLEVNAVALYLAGRAQTAMFSSREQDAVQRARLLKRVSFAVAAAPRLTLALTSAAVPWLAPSALLLAADLRLPGRFLRPACPGAL